MPAVQPSDGLTKALAMYGAILSSIGLGWNLYRDLIDRARLKVEAQVRRIVRSDDGRWYATDPALPIAGASEQVFVVINVTNIGRRPLQWQGWGGKYHDRVNGRDSFVVIPTTLPRMLNEGETHSDFTAKFPTAENVKKLFVWDASGKEWCVSRRNLKKLVTDSRNYRTQSQIPDPHT